MGVDSKNEKVAIVAISGENVDDNDMNTSEFDKLKKEYLAEGTLHD